MSLRLVKTKHSEQLRQEYSSKICKPTWIALEEEFLDVCTCNQNTCRQFPAVILKTKLKTDKNGSAKETSVLRPDDLKQQLCYTEDELPIPAGRTVNFPVEKSSQRKVQREASEARKESIRQLRRPRTSPNRGLCQLAETQISEATRSPDDLERQLAVGDKKTSDETREEAGREGDWHRTQPGRLTRASTLTGGQGFEHSRSPAFEILEDFFHSARVSGHRPSLHCTRGALKTHLQRKLARRLSNSRSVL